VVARATAVLTLGVDAEPNEPLPAGILGDIARPQEQSTVAALRRADPSVRWDRLLFSAKESVYKAWFPLARRWLDFHEAVIAIDPAAGIFRARLLVPGPVLTGGNALTGFTGRWCADRAASCSPRSPCRRRLPASVDRARA
jgi:4'-phosphopantetheinyl transferase EntD